jgi:hypothetical protein
VIRSIAARRPGAAMIVAIVAVVMALAGTATAAGLITSSQIRDDTIVSADVKNRSLKLRDLSAGVQRSIKASAEPAPAGPAGLAGPAGPAGPTGPQGVQGAPGLAEVEIVSKTSPSNNIGKFRQVACPEGKTLIAPGATTAQGGFLSAVRPTDGGGAALAAAADDPADGNPWSLTVYAVCAKVG